MRRALIFLLCAGTVTAADLNQARTLYLETRYQEALAVLASLPQPESPAALQLSGQAAFMLGNFKQASEYFDRAVAASPSSSGYLWLGRALGRRAETGSMISAPGLASRARQAFEKAVEMDPANQDAIDDLFSYYLEAPGFLGGGLDKAAALAERSRASNPVTYHGRMARLAVHRKEFDAAESQLRRAIALAPKSAAAFLALARFLARTGRAGESDKALQAAESLSPNDPNLIFARAQVYIEGKRNYAEARRLLEGYLRLPLTPDHPSRDEARKLLKTVSGD